MKTSQTRSALGATFMIVVAMLSTATVAADQQFTGYARSRADGKLLYVESHHVRRAGEVGETRVVMYRCSADGPAFARKELTYGASRETPEFTFTDARSGYVEGLRRTAEGPRVFQQDGPKSPRREAKAPTDAALVSDAGFDEFVRKHWAALEAGKTVRFPFLIPSRLDYLTFKVKKHGETKIEGATASVIRLNLSGVFGWFLPYIEVTYRKSDRLLKRYEGLTNIRGEDGRNLVATIEFPSRDRRSGTPSDFVKLRAEPLVPRC
jgi:hypothetical protein